MAVITVVATVHGDAVQSWLSERSPVEYTVLENDAYPSDGWDLVVSDRERLPSDLDTVDDCPRLWEIGRAAGGVQTSFSQRQVVLRGVAQRGVTIVDVRARITGRSRPEGGVLLSCPSAGGAEPIGLSFDLSDRTVAPAQRLRDNPANLGDFVNQFQDGFVINVADKESVSLRTETLLPADAVTWHLEADLLVGGKQTTLTIDDAGRDFRSPGRLEDNEYREGHRAGVSTVDWGVLPASEQTGPGGDRSLRLGPVEVPADPGLDFYQPRPAYPEEGDRSRYRWIRQDGRKLVTFNSPGTAPVALPRPGDLCPDTGPSEGSISADFGHVTSAPRPEPSAVPHGSQQFQHWTMSVECRMGSGGRPARTLQFLAARRVGSPIVFTASTTDPTSAHWSRVTQVLSTVRDHS